MLNSVAAAVGAAIDDEDWETAAELKAALDAAVQKVLHRGTAPLGRMCVMRVSLRVSLRDIV